MSQLLHSIFPAEDAIPPQFRIQEPIEQREYLINGELKTWTGNLNPVMSPVCLRSGKDLVQPVIGRTPLLTTKESLEALDAAVKAYDLGHGLWPSMSVTERIEHVEGFLQAMREKRDDVVKLLMWEIGKTLKDSEKEFDRTTDYIIETIKALKDLDRNSAKLIEDQGFMAQIRRVPLGVALCMGPYNYPLNETFTTLIPALIMGNTVIFKPPRYGVLLHAPLLEAFAESLPRGVINTVYGEGPTVVGPLMQSGHIDVLAFIGSAKVASLLKHQHPRPNRLRCVLGLEAKNPAIVLPHADLDLAVRECALGAFSFNGQRCTAIKIVFVHQSVAAPFVERLAEAVGALRVGMPWEEGVNITPLPEDGKQRWLEGLVAEAVSAGASVRNPGGAHVDHTLFYPAVLYPARPEMRVCQVEQFGPVLPVVPYEDEREVIDWIVASPVGQQAALFGNDPEQLSRLIDVLANQVCRVNINSQCQRGPDTLPFTGRKDSAEGTLSVSDALRVFSIRSLVAAKANDQNERILSDIVRGRHSRFLSTDFIF